MIPKIEVLSIAPERELLPNVVEKDYVLGWLLMGIAGHLALEDLKEAVRRSHPHGRKPR